MSRMTIAYWVITILHLLTPWGSHVRPRIPANTSVHTLMGPVQAVFVWQPNMFVQFAHVFMFI